MGIFFKTIGVVLGIAVGLVIIVAVVGALSGHSSSSSTPPPPAAIFDVTASTSDSSCTVLGDYCIKVYCTFYNRGDGPGEKVVRAQLLDSGDLVATRESNLTLMPGQNQQYSWNFPEAELDDDQHQHHYQYKCLVE